MATKLRILTIGDTSGIHFITSQLALLKDDIDLSCFSSQVSASNIFIHGSGSYSFTIQDPIYRSIDHLLNYPPKECYDIVFLACRSFPDYRRNLHALKSFINSDSIIIVDGGLGISLEVIVHECLPDLTVLCFFVDIDVKCLGDGQLYSNKETAEVLIGYSGITKYQPNKTDIQKYRELAAVYLSKTESNLNKICQLVQNKDSANVKLNKDIGNNKLISHIWLHSILLISGEILPIVFDEFDFEKIISSSTIKPVFKGLVSELICISFYFGIGDFRSFLMELFGDSNIEVIARQISRKSAATEDPTSYEPPFLKSSKFQFDFFHNLDNYSFILVFQTILISDGIGISNPNLTFLYGMLVRLSQISDVPIWLKRRSNEQTPMKRVNNKLSEIPTNNLPIKPILTDNKDDNFICIDRELALLYLDADNLPLEPRDKPSSNMLSAPKSGEEETVGNEPVEHLKKVTSSSKAYEYEEEERNTIHDFFIRSGYSSSSSSNTEDGIDTITGLDDFSLPKSLRPKTAQPIPSKKFYDKRKPFKKKSVHPKSKKFEPIRWQRAEFLSYKDYGSRHVELFDVYGVKHEEGNRDRFAHVASSTKASAYE